MTKHTNRSLLLFLALGLGLASIIALVVTRSLPLLVKEQIYSCQAFMQSITIDVVTCHLRNLLLGSLGTMLAIIGIKIAMVYRQIQILRQAAIDQPHHKPLQRALKKHQLQNQVVIIQTPKILAFCFGLQRPKIYISSGLLELLDEQELQAVLLHEKHHLVKADSLTLFIASSLLILFPFFPILADLINHFRLQAEIEADTAAILALGQKQPVLSVLKKMLLFQSPSNLGIAALADATLSSRIEYLTTGIVHRPSLSIFSSTISFASVSLLVSLLLLPARAMATEPNQTTNFCIGGTDCAVHCSSTPAISSPATIPPMSVAL